MRYPVKFERPTTNLSYSDKVLGFTLQEQEEETILNIQGVIGSAWDGLTASDVVPMIQAIEGPIRMRLNTPGGFVHDALDVYDALLNHEPTVTADIVSEAWSAGTILTSAADEVRIRPAAVYGMHRSWSGALVMGNCEEMEGQLAQIGEYIQSLRNLDVQIAEMIAEKSGNTVKQVHDWMVGPDGVDGTEFRGQEAVAAGLADSLIETPKKESNQHIDKARATERTIKLMRLRSRSIAEC